MYLISLVFDLLVVWIKICVEVKASLNFLGAWVILARGDWGLSLGLVSIIKRLGISKLPSQDLTEIMLKQHKSSKQPNTSEFAHIAFSIIPVFHIDVFVFRSPWFPTRTS